MRRELRSWAGGSRNSRREAEKLGERFLKVGLKILISAGVLASLISCGVRREAGGYGYPRWFLEGVGDQGIRCAVGYGRIFVDPDTSVAYAMRDGVERVAREMAVAIRSEQGFSAVPGGLRSMGGLFSEEVDWAKVETIREQCRVVDSAQVHGMTLALVCHGSEGAFEVERARMPEKAPKWVRKLPKKKGYVFSVGTSHLYYHEANSWREAERAARLELARDVLSQIRDLSKQAGGTLEQVIVTKTEATLRGTRIAGRWLDGKEKACYVLCRMPIR